MQMHSKTKPVGLKNAKWCCVISLVHLKLKNGRDKACFILNMKQTNFYCQTIPITRSFLRYQHKNLFVFWQNHKTRVQQKKKQFQRHRQLSRLPLSNVIKTKSYLAGVSQAAMTRHLFPQTTDRGRPLSALRRLNT